MSEPTENAMLKSLTDENAELTESICSWSRNCAQLSNQITKLKVFIHNLTAENERLKIAIEKGADRLRRNSRDIKYVMEMLDKMTRQNKKLKEENAKLGAIPNDKKPGESVREKNTLTDETASLMKDLLKKDDTIKFYREVCDAKASEVDELKQINRMLKSKLQRNKQ